MPIVDCFFYGRLYQLLGEKHVQLVVDGQTVREVLKALCHQYPQLTPILFRTPGDLSIQVNILLNGHSIRLLKGLDTKITSQDQLHLDRIDILEIVGGGESRY